TERRVRLVADHELVGVPAQRADMPCEPGVRLDRQRIRDRRLVAGLDRLGVAVAVALRLEVAVELGDEEAAVREDQDAQRSRRFDEAGGRDRLARSGRVAEAVAPNRARILGSRELLVERLVVAGGVVAVLVFL